MSDFNHPFLQSIQEHLQQKRSDTAYRESLTCEYRDLLIWVSEKYKELDQIPYSGGQDGPHTEASGKLHIEYLRRVKLLEQKYNRTLKKMVPRKEEIEKKMNDQDSYDILYKLLQKNAQF